MNYITIHEQSVNQKRLGESIFVPDLKKYNMQDTEIQELLNLLENNQKYMITSQRNYLKAVKKLLDNNGTVTQLHHSLLMKLKQHIQQ